eukprot:5344135-Pyramimonas_sp.AAC.1
MPQPAALVTLLAFGAAGAASALPRAPEDWSRSIFLARLAVGPLRAGDSDRCSGFELAALALL